MNGHPLKAAEIADNRRVRPTNLAMQALSVVAGAIRAAAALWVSLEV
jgi:hypothetical protein